MNSKMKMLLESLDKIGEGEQLTIAPAQQNTQIIKQGDKTLGAITNPSLAQQVKNAIGKGEMTLSGDDTQLKEDESEYAEGDQVKVIGDVEFKDSTGTITYVATDGKFLVVDIDGEEHSFHCSDIEPCDEDCDLVDDQDDDYDYPSKEQFMESKLDEGSKSTGLSPQTLADYKKKAGKDALDADKKGNFKRADKRFYGIVSATKKEFANDMRGIKEDTASPQFKAWFGASKVVDDSGEPLVMYHGTSKDVDFDKFKVGARGAWFTSHTGDASNYAKDNESKETKYDHYSGKFNDVNTADRVMPVYLKIVNPYKMTDADFKRMNVENYAKAQKQIFAELKAKGHDGVYMQSGDRKIWAVLGGSNQIKSAIGNSGEYSDKPSMVKESKEFADMDEWFKAVKAENPGKKLRLVDRVEGKKKTTSAEVNGEDRSYGVWDNTKESGVILGESRDVKFEAWDKKLATILAEEFTISSTIGNTPGAETSVNVYATGEDAEQINQLLTAAGIGKKEQSATATSYGLPTIGQTASTDDYSDETSVSVDDDEGILDLIKRMSPNIVSAEIVDTTDGIESSPPSDGEAEVDAYEYPAEDTGSDDSETDSTASDEDGESTESESDDTEKEDDDEELSEEFANEPEEKEMDTDYLTKTISGGLNKIKRSNTVGNPTKVEIDESIMQLLRLSGQR